MFSDHVTFNVWHLGTFVGDLNRFDAWTFGEISISLSHCERGYFVRVEDFKADSWKSLYETLCGFMPQTQAENVADAVVCHIHKTADMHNAQLCGDCYIKTGRDGSVKIRLEEEF